MGQEIQHGHFRKQDFAEYERRLQLETELLQSYFDQQCFADDALTAGFEMEAWLVNAVQQPLAENEHFLDTAKSDLLSPELARFNVEINSVPRPLKGRVLAEMQYEFEQTLAHCNKILQPMGGELLFAGILPTVQEHEIVLDNMSAMTRYRALNEQIRRLRKGAPLKLDIEGRDQHLQTWHKDVMLESVATSFQLHLQVSQKLAVQAYNAAIMASAPIVALSANSPYLFGYDLWAETRIPVFEQAVSICTAKASWNERVTFGSGYVKESLMECFTENIAQHPVLLPELTNDDSTRLCHLRLHNGTIWRWNRPLIGFDKEGKPHLRIEHRVIPAGPSTLDSFANAAMFYGLLAKWLGDIDTPASKLPFADAKNNFYLAARDGLDANLRWPGGNTVNARALWQETLLAQAAEGLVALDIDRDNINDYVDIIRGRLQNGQNGAAWQRAFVAKHKADMHMLAAAYHDNQRQGQPVHEWTI